MTRVKICGLMTPGDVRLCTESGADAVGFVTEYPLQVPWNIDRARARELVASTPPFVTTTAVVGGGVESILQIADMVRPALLQLFNDLQSDCSLTRNYIRIVKWVHKCQTARYLKS